MEKSAEEKDVQDQESETNDPADEPAADRGEGSAGPAEDLEQDPAYDPDDENLKGIKGG